MGQHRSASGKRGISRWLVLAVVALLVLAAAIFGWLQLRDQNENRKNDAAAACFDGDRTLTVAADPEIAPEVRQIADRYNDTKPVARDQCITVTVQDVPADQMMSALAADSSQDLPAVWVAQSEVDLALARAAHPDALSPSSRSVATSPVQLAMTKQQAATLTQMSWEELPARENAGELGLTLPSGPDSGANTLALSAVLAAVADVGEQPLSAEQVDSPAARDALSTLRAGAAGRTFADTAAALAAVSDAPNGTLAVPVTAQQLRQAVDDQQNSTVRALSPAGAAPMADYPATTLSDAEADETLSRAASAFSEFGRQPEQLELLAAAGFQTDQTESMMPTPSPGAIAKIAPRRASAQQPRATTILLDVSGSMREVDGNQTRLLNVTNALRTEVATLSDDFSVGLWRYSANLVGNTPYAIDVATGPLGDAVGDGGTRRQLLNTALDLARPVSATHTYRSLDAAYASAAEAALDGEPNSVLLITDGPNDDQSYLDSQRLLQSLADAQDPTNPVTVDIIAISRISDMATLQAVADKNGGTLTAIDSSADPALAAAIQAAMG